MLKLHPKGFLASRPENIRLFRIKVPYILLTCLFSSLVVASESTSAIMATHSLAIAKASLAAGMMRPDPNPVSRADVASFHALLEGLVDKCTPANVEV